MGRDQIRDLYAQAGPRIAVLLTTRFGFPAEVSQDAIQEIFTLLLDNKRLRNQVASLAEDKAFAYLLVSAKHRAAREMERQRRQGELPEDLTALPAVSNPEAVLREQQLEAKVYRHLTVLPSPYREVLMPLLREHHSIEQIASDLNRPRNTVDQQIRRGLALLRRKFPRTGR
jgi:RNA polymerase sigma factor (sigma-70 family)